MTKEELKALARACINGETKAERAVLEFIDGEIDRGPGNAKPGPEWAAYCEERGNCSYADFDMPLCHALERFVKALNERGSEPLAFSYGCCDTCSEMALDINNEFVCDVLHECHH